MFTGFRSTRLVLALAMDEAAASHACKTCNQAGHTTLCCISLYEFPMSKTLRLVECHKACPSPHAALGGKTARGVVPQWHLHVWLPVMHAWYVAPSI